MPEISAIHDHSSGCIFSVYLVQTPLVSFRPAPPYHAPLPTDYVLLTFPTVPSRTGLLIQGPVWISGREQMAFKTTLVFIFLRKRVHNFYYSVSLIQKRIQ